jgi:hypothetical protein
MKTENASPLPSNFLWLRPLLKNHANFIGGAVSGLVSAVCVTPLDVVKVRMQVQARSHTGEVYKGTIQSLRMIATSEGEKLSNAFGMDCPLH